MCARNISVENCRGGFILAYDGCCGVGVEGFDRTGDAVLAGIVLRALFDLHGLYCFGFSLGVGMWRQCYYFIDLEFIVLTARHTGAVRSTAKFLTIATRRRCA